MELNYNFLNKLFTVLNASEIEYCILRGYEGLPNEVSNDVDFGVSKDSLTSFFDLLIFLSKEYGYSINISLIRDSVIKMSLSNIDGTSLMIDVWWNFNLLGLRYTCISRLLKSKEMYNNSFYVPSKEHEFALSFLKELLHNNWIRKDKIELLKSKITQDYYLPFHDYFSISIVDEFVHSVMSNKHKITFISLKAKIQLVYHNIRRHGIIKVIINVKSFFMIKYFYKEQYSYLYNPKIKNV